MLRRFLTAFLLVCLTAGTGMAASKRPSGKSASAKRAAASKSKSSKSKSARARRSRPARQQAPTPERYKEIQQALADKGHYTGPIDGIWDEECKAALKEFQQEQNLTPDGKLGALSIIALGLGPKYEKVEQVLAKPVPTSTPESDQ